MMNAKSVQHAAKCAQSRDQTYDIANDYVLAGRIVRKAKEVCLRDRGLLEHH